ncbi:MAG TPA: sulfite exporter TauE/SafE family protein [Vicinamibacterales bacterium]|nr:sulfite exporter TauE/SafE family protein [Vicinamibacterales bacterium]
MTPVAFIGLVGLGSLAAGLLGAITGLGGGVVLVPLLVTAFGVDIRYAIGASIVSVIATSSGAAAAYVKEGFSNVRVGMLLEIGTTVGALSGAWLAPHVPARALAAVFGLVLIWSAYLARHQHDHITGGGHEDPLAARLRLDSSYPARDGTMRSYHVHNVPAGFGLMYVAGILSGLLGIGSGAVKVLAMDRAMKLPLKVSTTTSNFMIGVTAAASAGIYLRRGYIDPIVAMPVMLGVLSGSLLGSIVLRRARSAHLRTVLVFVIVLLGVEMLVSAFTGRVAA